MRVPNLPTLLEVLEISSGSPSNDGRRLQFPLPDYTSPPLPEAIDATPDAYRADDIIQAGRDLDAAGSCIGELGIENANACHIIFTPPALLDSDEGGDSSGKVGVIFFGGALVDPRGYSPLMKMLSDTYNLPVVVPIFTGDMAFKFGVCETGRLGPAKSIFPHVEKWIFAGHSFGGIAAYNDIWAMTQQRNDTDAIGGVVMIGSYVRQDLGCGMSDFSTDDWDWLPFASISASEDGIVNATNFEAGKSLLPMEDSTNNFRNVVIEGGNHGYFGTYDYSERETLLFQFDGNATITRVEQQELTAEVIAEIATLAEGIIDGGVTSNETVISEETGEEVVTTNVTDVGNATKNEEKEIINDKSNITDVDNANTTLEVESNGQGSSNVTDNEEETPTDNASARLGTHSFAGAGMLMAIGAATLLY